MQELVKIKISATIANDYATRDVYDFVSMTGGIHHLTREQAQELLSDAKYMVFDTDLTPAGITRAYSALASNLMAALA